MSLVNNRDERQRSLWEATYNGSESATVEFWAYIFKEQIFKGPDFSIAPESPPTTARSDRRRVDLVIKKWQDSRSGKKARFGALLFFEAKKHKASQKEIEILEHQAFTASIAWLQENDAAEAYSMTAIGDAAKLWYTTIESDYPIPMVPTSRNLADRSTYINANSSEAQRLRDGFEAILRYPQGLPSDMIKVLRSNATTQLQPPAADRGGYVTDSIGQPDFKNLMPQTTSGQFASRRELYQVSYASGSGTNSGKGKATDVIMGDPQDNDDFNKDEEDQFESTQSEDRDPAPFFVQVKKVGHTTRKDEYLFTDNKNRERSTLLSDWTKIRYRERQAWMYQRKGQTYISYDKVFK
ncbi:MAG: hypothetical protein M1818_004995 [Claussenomyces sp. TS43310]|nr:MAG: hypothetical protein M1818_004995 [Claussenomyces sp. TS43310]